MRSLKRLLFDKTCKGIVETEPIQCLPSYNIAIVSMVCHSALYMYLVAIKSFVHNLGYVPSIYVLNDGSLTNADMFTIRQHIRSVKIVFISDIERHPDVPIGGTWERLLFIADLVKDKYVIQLDSDTITFEKMATVENALSTNVNFTLADRRGDTAIYTFTLLKDMPQTKFKHLVQSHFEFSHIKDSKGYSRYVCGNSGFVGFGIGSFNKSDVAAVAKLIAEVCVDKIYEWGSEQVASNIIVAKQASIKVLAKKYSVYIGNLYHANDAYLGASTFLHFVGSHRFDKSLYLKSVRSTIKVLMKVNTQIQGKVYQSQASRMRGEGSRIMAEGARLENIDIPYLRAIGKQIQALGREVARDGDKLFSEGTALLNKE